MKIERANAKNPRPGALVRRRRTWPPFSPPHEVESPRFCAPQPWQPRRWDRVDLRVPDES